MPLASGLSSGLLYVAFNQDNTCISLADSRGFKIYSLETHKLCYLADIGGVRSIEMLFSTSLAAYVGSGDQPKMSPRKLTLMNTTAQSTIQSLSLPTAILAVRLNRRRLVAVLERRTYVHNLDTLELLRTIETEPNPSGLCALTVSQEPCYLALPASPALGSVRVYDLASTPKAAAVLCEVAAHRAPLAVLQWSPGGTLLATASTKGTVVRVHEMPHAKKVHTFRRGTYPATIYSLAFSPPGLRPGLLAAASAHGTVHLFSLEEADRQQRSPAAQAASGLLASVFSSAAVADVVDPPRCILTLKLPCQNVPALVALGGPREGPAERDFGPGLGLQGPEEGPAAAAGAGACARVVVATGEGLLYEYSVEGLGGPGAPSATKDQEYYLLAGSPPL